MKIGAMNHIVTIELPSAPVTDGALGYTQTWTPIAQRVPANVRPATARDLERVIANTVESAAAHLVETYYVSGISTKARVVVHDWTGDRILSVVGVHDAGGQHLAMELACEEVVS